MKLRADSVDLMGKSAYLSTIEDSEEDFSPFQTFPRLIEGTGVGVNAASKMIFVASDALSELVWSPHNGLSLKCADCSLTEKKPFLLWDVGPSNAVLSSSESIKCGTTSDKPVDEQNLFTSQVDFCMEKEVGEGASMVGSPTGIAGISPIFGRNQGYHTDDMEELKVTGGVSAVHANQREESTRNIDRDVFCSPNDLQVTSTAESRENNEGPENQMTPDYIPVRTEEARLEIAQTKTLLTNRNEGMITNSNGKVGNIVSASQILGIGLALTSEVHSKALDIPVAKLTSRGKGDKDVTLVIEDESKSKIRMDVPDSLPPPGKVESTAENNYHLLIDKKACRQSDKGLPSNEFGLSEGSPTNSRARLYRRKGKEKALSDRAVNERMSNDEDDSHESVESCNSAGLFSSGKKRWSFEEQWIVGSKRAKKQIGESPASTSFVGQDSSFMNWISNMVKGLNKTNRDDSPFLALTFNHPNHGHESYDQQIMTYSRNRHPGSRNMGFQTIFQSLYCSEPKDLERKAPNGNSTTGGSKEILLADKQSGANVTPIACHGGNDNFCKQRFQSNKKFNQSTSGSEAGPSFKLKTSTANIPAAPEMCKTSSSSEQNKAWNLGCIDVKNKTNSSASSLGKRKVESSENNVPDPLPEAKVTDNFGYGCNPLESFWVTRLYPRTSGPVLNLENGDQDASGALDRSADCARVIPDNHVDFPIEQKYSEAKEYSNEDLNNVVGKEPQYCAPNSDASYGFKRLRGHSAQKSVYKSNPFLPSPKYKNSEAIASVFARRLDALKHIIPLGMEDNPTRTMTTCFHCGKSGHDLRDCSEVTEGERQTLLSNISSYNGAEESPCFCIRCFQLDHWAISCPMASTSMQHPSGNDTALGNHLSASKMRIRMGNERDPRMLENKQLHFQAAEDYTNCDGENSQVDINKHVASISWDSTIKGKQISPLSELADRKSSDAPEGMFDAIRKLRLSRMDILKWMNSCGSLLHLNGFFLRVRLGKWEKGIGGTGYYVARIAGMAKGEQGDKPPKIDRKPLAVIIGGTRCLVESQYISNQDFLEEELTAWLCTATTSGGKIPSEDHFKLKLEERKRFGF
ncbi:uncharacterized protein LOC127799445 isoform X2 [Diospyros lotus]|uniref:uncharacterized protein LOC127799445 isoform X2 n=1 Tax=Diospyros lotus TaxID=55363 RepID=UPI00225B1F86|nr:uncharacterized protein LOC127799445 isoform X2 [Diospyros lotus]